MPSKRSRRSTSRPTDARASRTVAWSSSHSSASAVACIRTFQPKRATGSHQASRPGAASAGASWARHVSQSPSASDDSDPRTAARACSAEGVPFAAPTTRASSTVCRNCSRLTNSWHHARSSRAATSPSAAPGGSCSRTRRSVASCPSSYSASAVRARRASASRGRSAASQWSRAAVLSPASSNQRAARACCSSSRVGERRPASRTSASRTRSWSWNQPTASSRCRNRPRCSASSSSGKASPRSVRASSRCGLTRSTTHTSSSISTSSARSPRNASRHRYSSTRRSCSSASTGTSGCPPVTRAASPASWRAAAQPPEWAAAERAAAREMPGARAVSTCTDSSGEQRSCGNRASASRPDACSRSTGSRGVRRLTSTRCSHGGTCSTNVSSASSNPATPSRCSRPSRTRTSGGRVRSSSDSSSACTAPAGSRCARSSAVAWDPQSGTCASSAAITPVQRRPASRSASSSDSQDVACTDRAAQSATSVVFPAPAGATTSVTGRVVRSSSRSTSRSRRTKCVGVRGARSFEWKNGVCGGACGTARAALPTAVIPAPAPGTPDDSTVALGWARPQPPPEG